MQPFLLTDPTHKFSLICRQHKDLHARIITFNLIAFNLMRGKAKTNNFCTAIQHEIGTAGTRELKTAQTNSGIIIVSKQHH